MTEPRYQAVLFDLDGTLLDTLDDIAEAANRVLASRGFETHPRDAYRWFVGDGSKLLMTRALPESQRTPRQIESCYKAFIRDYNVNWDRATQPYDGIAELIDTLREKSIKMGVVTNKPHQFTAAMMSHYFSDEHFDPVLGQQEGIPKKPDPHLALTAADRMGIRPAHCIFLGDSDVDMQTAVRAGMHPIGASWGFRSRAELIDAGAADVIDDPLDLLNMMD